jgi:hypothetical protein
MDSHAPTGFGVMVGDEAVGNMGGPVEDEYGNAGQEGPDDNGEDMVAFGSNAGLFSSQLGELRDDDDEDDDDDDDDGDNEKEKEERGRSGDENRAGLMAERDEKIRQLEATVEAQSEELVRLKASLAAALEQIAKIDGAASAPCMGNR